MVGMIRAATFALALLLALAPAANAQGAECERAQAVTAPCAGLLIPFSEATRAVRCKTVDLPQCHAELRRAEGLLALKTTPPTARTSSWVPWVAGVAIGLAAGVVVGILVER